MEVVAVLGASNDSSRYAYKAMEMLKEYGHRPIGVHPRETEVLGEKVYPSVAELIKNEIKVDTVTVYVGAAISQKMTEDLLRLKPQRVIFNPGAENPELEKKLQAQGINCERACTLVLLRTHQF